MRLELKQIAGEAVRMNSGGWSLEWGRKTLGRGADCDWQTPDPERLVSKLHCTIERDREGFLLRDQSANGSRVDGVTLHEGDTARLGDQSRIEFGGLAFSVKITGAHDTDNGDPDAHLALSDEPLTISSILADVAPGGRIAAGILGRRGDDWADLPPAAPQRKIGGKSSRDIGIGWDGPPSPGRVTQQILPEDWNDDFDGSNRYEHQAATHVSVPAPRRGPRASVGVEVELSATPDARQEPVLLVDTAAPGPASQANVASLLDRIGQFADRMDEAIEAAYSSFDLDRPLPDEEGDFLATDREAALTNRLNNLIERQLEFNELLERLVREASHRLEPRILEARVDAEPRKLPWRNDRSYWRAYCAQFEQEDRQLSLRELFRAAMLGSNGNTETTAGKNPKT